MRLHDGHVHPSNIAAPPTPATTIGTETNAAKVVNKIHVSVPFIVLVAVNKRNKVFVRSGTMMNQL